MLCSTAFEDCPKFLQLQVFAAKVLNSVCSLVVVVWSVVHCCDSNWLFAYWLFANAHVQFQMMMIGASLDQVIKNGLSYIILLLL